MVWVNRFGNRCNEDFMLLIAEKMDLSSSKDSKIAEIEMISMLSTKCSSENFEFSQIYGVV